VVGESVVLQEKGKSKNKRQKGEGEQSHGGISKSSEPGKGLGSNMIFLEERCKRSERHRGA
jgi:hypothetical protein